MGQIVDAVIVGAGITGSSTALELARRGLQVALFDKKSVGAPTFDPGLFRFARFAQGDLVRGQYEHRIVG